MEKWKPWRPHGKPFGGKPICLAPAALATSICARLNHAANAAGRPITSSHACASLQQRFDCSATLRPGQGTHECRRGTVKPDRQQPAKPAARPCCQKVLTRALSPTTFCWPAGAAVPPRCGSSPHRSIVDRCGRWMRALSLPAGGPPHRGNCRKP